MARPAARELTERELEVLQAFWKVGEATVADVQGTLAGSGLKRAYTTIATLVRILHEKGFLEQTHQERPYRFRPARTQEEVSGRLLGDLVERVFGGSREQLLLHLFDHKKLSAKERAVLETLLKERAQ